MRLWDKNKARVIYSTWFGVFELCLSCDYISRRAVVGQVDLIHSKRILGSESDYPEVN